MPLGLLWRALIAVVAMGATSAFAAPNCPFSSGPSADARSNKLYLYFSPTDDASFPNVTPSGTEPRPTPSTPLHRFNVSELPAYTGTGPALQDKIYDVVADIYCEFNVQVIKTTSAPAGPAARRNTIGIGTDANSESPSSPCGRFWFGQTLIPNGDPNDAHPIDFGRIWAGTYQACAGGPGGELQGSKSTLERWANSIGSTAAHEAAHNYGLSHADGIPHGANEDAPEHHLMRVGTAYSFEQRTKRRHFSDFEYSKLAGIIGLAMDTMWNWDFTNPNGGTTPNATKLRMEFVSANPSLMLSWSYSGQLSPWVNPVLTSLGTRPPVRGLMHAYAIEWSAGQSWANGPNGEVPNKAKFHVGATFSSVGQTDPDAIIITDVKLLGANGQPLEQHPRWVGFDAATFNPRDGVLSLRIFNLLNKPLMLRNVVVQHLPRVMSIDAMMANKTISDVSGRAFRPWRGSSQRALATRTIAPGEDTSIPVGDVRKRPYVFHRTTARECEPPPGGHEPRCQPGRVSVDLFPASTTYVTATIVDPETRVESRLYYQIAGRRLPLEVRLAPHLR